MIWIDETMGLSNYEEEGFLTIGYLSSPILIGLISYTLKPFIVKD